MGGGCAVALPVAQALALKEARGPAAGKAVAHPDASTEVLAGAEGVANARDIAIAKADADPEILSDSEALSHTQTYSGVEAGRGAGQRRG